MSLNFLGFGGPVGELAGHNPSEPKEEGRGTRNGYEASKGSKGISALIEALIEALGALIEALDGLDKHPRL